MQNLPRLLSLAALGHGALGHGPRGTDMYVKLMLPACCNHVLVSDPGGSCLRSAAMKPWRAPLLASKQRKILSSALHPAVLDSCIAHCPKILNINLFLRLIVIELSSIHPLSSEELEQPVHFHRSDSTILGVYSLASFFSWCNCMANQYYRNPDI